MNRFLLTIFVALNFQACVQVQEKVLLEKPKVDKRVELLSIVFRLAEKPEYSAKDFKLYVEKIEHYFERHKNHELIQFTKSIMYENKIGYNQVMSMAISLDDHLNLLPDVTDIWLYTGWGEEDAKKFVLLLQQFAKDTDFDKFFENNADLYTETIKCFAPVYEKMNLNWYCTFYGKEPAETFSIIVGLGNWDCNYAANLDYTDGNRTVFAFMGIWRIDSLGMPEFRVNEYFPIILHEFNHSFAPQLPGNIKDHTLKESGEKIFSFVKDIMTSQAYPLWEVMLNEAIVRAAVIKYMKDNNFEQYEIETEIKIQKEKGFFWIEELVEELERYDEQRDKYPTLENYIPKLSEAYKIWAENLTNMQ